ncbi:hypothetical protein [Halopiger thermotolerans]
MTSPTSQSSLSRRAVLLGTSGALALSAGCIQDLDDSTPGSGSDDSGGNESNGGNESDDGNESDTGNESDDESGANGSDGSDGSDGTGEPLEHETHSYQYPETPTEPDASLFVTQDRAEDWLADRGLEEDPVAEFVADTTFNDSVLVPLEADAPTHCYEMVLESIGLTETEDSADVLDLEAAVRDVSEETEYCAQAKTTVGLLVRATFESEPVTEMSVRIVDENGREYGIGAASDSASASGGNETAANNESETENDADADTA